MKCGTNLSHEFTKPIEAYGATLTDANIETVGFGNAAVSAFQGAEDALVTFAQTSKLSFSSLIDSLIADLLRLQIRQSFIAPLFDIFSGIDLFGSGSGGKTGFDFGQGNKAGVRFEGGGFTGMGARAGGIDGKGGFPAILHLMKLL